MKLALTCALIALAACQQSSAQEQTDPYGPVRCWMTAWDSGLDEDHAIQLCQGALNSVPGQCYALAVDHMHNLSTQQIVQLCTGTTTIEPVACFARVYAEGTMTEDQAITYCTPVCPLGPPPAQTSSLQCVGIALTYANIPHQTAQELCQNARSAGPALCFMSGRNLHTISDSKLVNLCADFNRCQYVVTPSGGY